MSPLNVSASSALSTLPWLAASVAAIVTTFIIALQLKRRWMLAVDLPNERSLHSVPTPRSGGIALMAGLLCAALVAWLATGIWWWLETLLAATLAGISLLDDHRSLGVRVRLVAHGAVALVYAAWLLTDDHAGAVHILWVAAAALVLVTAINFYNFMDGSNGIAGGMACIGFGAYGWCAWPGHPALAALSFAIAGAAAGFLLFNLRGKIFLGDGGSVPLGFLAGALGLHGAQAGVWPFWFPLLLFAPFVADAGVTLARRLLRGEPFWLAHRQHYYQRLVLMGATHGKVAAGEFTVMLVCAGGALSALHLDAAGRGAIFATIGAGIVWLMAWIDWCWRRFNGTP